MILARLFEEEKLAPDDKLSRWIPDFPRADDITVADLAGHRAGIPHILTSPLDETKPRTPADMVELAKRAGLDFEPGSQSRYSSGGFSVLARLLELAAGKSYEELLAEHVTKPAGLEDTFHVSQR